MNWRPRSSVFAAYHSAAELRSALALFFNRTTTTLLVQQLGLESSPVDGFVRAVQVSCKTLAYEGKMPIGNGDAVGSLSDTLPK